MDAIITFQDVTYTYPQHQPDPPAEPVLRGVSLAIRKGELIALLGHNGSGKSTLVKMTNGFLLPDSGQVTVAGMDTRDTDRLWDIRQTVGMVFQNPDNQIVATVVEEDVAFALENLGVPSEEIRRRVDEALETVGMTPYREHAPHRLSGGQKQRIAIAGALAMGPMVLALDEPTAMLDPKGRDEVMDTVLRLVREQGVTVLMVTHHMNEAALCDRAVVMDKGRVCMDDTPGHIFLQAETLADLGLTVPQTVRLARMLGITDTAPLTDEACALAIHRHITACQD